MFILKFRVESRVIYLFILMCFSFPFLPFPEEKTFSELNLEFSFRLEE